MKHYLQSNTVRLGLAAILAGAVAYLSGQVDVAGALLLVVTGILQVIQRTAKLKQDGTPAAPGAFPGVDAGPGTGQ